MPVLFKVSAGEEGEVQGFSDPVLSLSCNKAFSPGRPICFKLLSDQGELTLQGKTIGSKRQLDDRFEIRVKVINLRRAEKELLLALFSPL
jgi:hypothetical protein